MTLRIRSAREEGVTLIELTTAVVIVAILAAVAVPSYRSHLVRARRSEATAALLQLQAAQAKFYLQHFRYTSNLGQPPPQGLGFVARSEDGQYDISVALDTNPAQMGGQSYTATARPAPGSPQSDDTRCTSFTVTDMGLRGATGSGGAEGCWR